MRVCHIATRFIRGGADENTAHTCNGQVEAGHEVHFIVGKETDREQISTLRPEVRLWRVPTLVRQISPLRDAVAFVQLVLLLRKVRPDIVHTHLSKAGILGRLAAFVARTPIIVHGVHILPFINVSGPEAFIYRWVERCIASITSMFVNVGEEMKGECLKAGIGDPSRHVVIASGMDLHRFNSQLRYQLDWREVLGEHEISSSNPKLVLLVSRLEARKGQYEFLPTFAEIAREDPDVVLVIAGEGPEYERIANRLTNLNLCGRVIMTGFRSDIERLMAVSHIGLLTSRREGLPRVLVQYALMRLPIVAADIPGAREIVTPGVNGFLSSPGNWVQMRDSLVQLLRDSEIRRRFSSAQDLLDLSDWSVDMMKERFNILYGSLQQERGRAR